MNSSRPGFTNLTLIGMPGSGKSTVGNILANHYGFTFVDGDVLIESGEGRTLEQLIQQHGLQGFLAIEARYLRELCCERAVIAPGGSAVYDQDAMRNLRSLGPVVYLEVSLPEIENRVGDVRQRGVVIAPGMTVADLYAERHPLYMKYAHVRVANGGDDPWHAARQVLAALES